MTWSRSVFCVLAVASTVGIARAQDRPAQSDQQILIQLEKDWDAAFLRRDVAFVEKILADEFIATYSDGTVGDKAKELMLTAEFNQKLDSSTLDEFTVRIYGAAAVVWFSRHLVGPSQRRRLEVNYRFIDVVVWRADRW